MSVDQFDPEFDSQLKSPQKGVSRRLDRRSLVLLILLAMIWIFILWQIGLFRLALACIAMTLGGFLMVGLTFVSTALGFGLFAIGERIIKECRGPEPGAKIEHRRKTGERVTEGRGDESGY